jgi:hypothetical protein
MYIVFMNDSVEVCGVTLRAGDTLGHTTDEERLFKIMDILQDSGIPVTYMTINDNE